MRDWGYRRVEAPSPPYRGMGNPARRVENFRFQILDFRLSVAADYSQRDSVVKVKNTYYR